MTSEPKSPAALLEAYDAQLRREAEVVAGTEFAGLWGGATLKGWRGHGIYRALVAARAYSALDRGVRYLQSDCTEMSRPILERSGLVRVSTTTPFVWQRDPADA